MRESYQERYKRLNVKQIGFQLNIKTDADILERLNALKNKQGYLKELVRQDKTIYKNFK